MTIKANMSYEVKEWFANKIANDLQRNTSCCDVFAVLKETEKAVYAMLNLGCDFRKTMWVPKSVLIEKPVGTDENGFANYETIITDDYDAAVAEFKSFRNLFK